MINSKKKGFTNVKGFTIVELVIVIAVIAVLSAVLIPTFSNLVKKANESSDIQAVRNINIFLTTADITDDIDSILDVYEVFEESGYDVENYNPLYEGRTFYYDVELNKVLYVDNEKGNVLFPSEYKDLTAEGRDWLTLGMEIDKKPVSPTKSGDTDTYEITSANEYAYVAEKLSKSTTWNNNVIIKIANDLDFQGSYIAIDSIPEGKNLTITGSNENEKITMKNITSSEYFSENDEGRKYLAAGLIGKVSKNANVAIENIIFENINVKNTHTGNVALLIGSAIGSSDTGLVEISNVEIKNSTVIGHRSVGALVGMLYSSVNLTNVSLDNVNVKTVGGRSGLLFGFVSMSTLLNKNETELNEVLGYTATNCAFSIYENEQNASGIKDFNTDSTTYNATKEITSYSIDGEEKKYKTYGFNEKALYCKYNNSDPESYYLFELAK